MGQPHEPAPVLCLAAAFSRHAAALDWARETTEKHWGPVALASPCFAFSETDYYTPTMGAGLLKQFFAFERQIPPDRLPQLKLQTNDWEAAYAKLGRHAEKRPLNLDPGYLTAAKLVLASTKDHAHRLYLTDRIYAEVTLRFRQGRWEHHEWTFPDYRRPDYHEFFTACRDLLRQSERGRHV